MNTEALLHLLARAACQASHAPPEQTLTVHLAERDGRLVAAAVYDELRISPEWAA
jgi:hypothetical protein